MIAAIYARKSTDQTGVADDAKSVARQIESARTYAEAHGWTVAEAYIYVDDGISGAEFERRPAFQRLMAAVAAAPAPFQVLVMSEESRLGRESIETAYTLKQLVTAGVRVCLYLDDREITLGSFAENTMMFLRAEVAAEERRKSAQRTKDALARKARAGHVTGGRVFGYTNRRTEAGHVERVIEPAEAAVVARIFALCADGYGMKQTAKQLNAEAATCPRPQQARPSGWAPSSVREVLYRELYRGVIVWNKTKKRDAWGQHRATDRPETEWMRMEASHLRLVSDEAWEAAHRRLAESRALYLRSTNGTVWGHPARGTESKYLLVGLATCGVCGAGLSHVTRDHGQKRASFYTCTANLSRGRHVCTNNHRWSMERLNGVVLQAMADQVLSERIIAGAVAEAVNLMKSSGRPGPEAGTLRHDLESLTRELAGLTAALAAGGGDLQTLIDAVRLREDRKRAIEARLAALDAARSATPVDPAALAPAMRRRLQAWHEPLSQHVGQARQVLRKLMVGRLVVTPAEDDNRAAVVTGTATLEKVLGTIVEGSKGVASPPGFEPGFQP